jgi:hypothetical protein
MPSTCMSMPSEVRPCELSLQEGERTLFTDLLRLDHIVKVVRDGQTKRAPIERVADTLTGYFVPVVTLLAICTWAIWLGLGYGGILPSDYLDTPIGGWGRHYPL